MKILIFIGVLLVSLIQNGFFKPTEEQVNPYEQYETNWVIVLYTLKLLSIIGLPILLLNLLGNMIYPIFPETHRPLLSTPFFCFICIRVVTRGLYPDLVRRNVEKNLKICADFGLDRYVIEVVTDREITGLSASRKVMQSVVPNEYRTKTGAKFKTRALQYALEPSVSILQDDDWISYKTTSMHFKFFINYILTIDLLFIHY